MKSRWMIAVCMALLCMAGLAQPIAAAPLEDPPSTDDTPAPADETDAALEAEASTKKAA